MVLVNVNLLYLLSHMSPMVLAALPDPAAGSIPRVYRQRSCSIHLGLPTQNTLDVFLALLTVLETDRMPMLAPCISLTATVGVFAVVI